MVLNSFFSFNPVVVVIPPPGQQVVSGYTYKIVVKEDGTQSLIIAPATPQDSGEWTVIAQNRAGRNSLSVTLTVDGKDRGSPGLDQVKPARRSGLEQF